MSMVVPEGASSAAARSSIELKDACLRLPLIPTIVGTVASCYCQNCQDCQNCQN
jgi:hypothetical protein